MYLRRYNLFIPHCISGASGRAGRTVEDPSEHNGRGGHRCAGRSDGGVTAGFRRTGPGPAGHRRKRRTEICGGTRGAVQENRGRREIRRNAAQKRGRQNPTAYSQGRIHKKCQMIKKKIVFLFVFATFFVIILKYTQGKHSGARNV